MSAQAPTQANAAAGNPDPVRINFALPAGASVGTKVTGIIERTGNTSLELTRNNRLQWMPAVRDILATSGNDNIRGYDINIKRGGREIRSFPAQLLTASKGGPYYPGFPQNVGAGFIQFELEITEINGTPTAQTLTVDAIFAASTQIVTA